MKKFKEKIEKVCDEKSDEHKKSLAEEKLANEKPYEKSFQQKMLELHGKPKTRREFLAHGIVGMSTVAALPSIADLVLNTAHAQGLDCPADVFNEGVPFLCIDGAGGMNIAGGNVMVGFEKGGGQLDVDSPVNSYFRLGLGTPLHPSKSGMLNKDYGLVFHSSSGILQGMNEVLNGFMVDGKSIKDKVDGVIFCAKSADDTGNNQINTMYMAQKAGANGKLLHLVGNSGSVTGGKSAAPQDQVNLKYRPSQISSFKSAENLLSVGQVAMGKYYLKADGSDRGTENIRKFIRKIASLGKNKLDTFKKSSSTEQISKLLGCTFEKSEGLFQQFNAAMLNPNISNDMDVVTAFEGGSEKVASIANLVVNNIAGAGTISVGGCDYHSGNAMDGQNKDIEIGRYIGRCIKLASLKGKDLFIHLFTDGGVTGDSGGTQDANLPGRVIWTSDSGTRSSSVIIVYKHNDDGTPIIREPSQAGAEPDRQVGNFKRGGGVDLTSWPGANNHEVLWKAIILNYLAAMDRVGEFEEIFGRGTLPDDHENMIRLNPIVKKTA